QVGLGPVLIETQRADLAGGPGPERCDRAGNPEEHRRERRGNARSVTLPPGIGAWDLGGVAGSRRRDRSDGKEAREREEKGTAHGGLPVRSEYGAASARRSFVLGTALSIDNPSPRRGGGQEETRDSGPGGNIRRPA